MIYLYYKCESTIPRIFLTTKVWALAAPPIPWKYLINDYNTFIFFLPTSFFMLTKVSVAPPIPSDYNLLTILGFHDANQPFYNSKPFISRELAAPTIPSYTMSTQHTSRNL